MRLSSRCASSALFIALGCGNAPSSTARSSSNIRTGTASVASASVQGSAGSSELAIVKRAQSGAESVRQAAELYMSESESSCPTVRDLVGAKKLQSDRTGDPWGKPYKVLCEKGELNAVSFGADGVEGSADDVRDDTPPRDLEKIASLLTK